MQKSGEATQVIVYGPAAIGRTGEIAPFMDPIGGDVRIAEIIGIARKSGEGMFACIELGAELAAVVNITLHVLDQHAAPPIQGCATSPNLLKSSFA